MYADKNLCSLEVTVNKELASVCNWLTAETHKGLNEFLLTANKLFLKKSSFVIF